MKLRLADHGSPRSLAANLARFGLPICLGLLAAMVPIRALINGYWSDVSPMTWVQVLILMTLAAILYLVPSVKARIRPKRDTPVWVPPIAFYAASLLPLLTISAGFKQLGDWLYTSILQFRHMQPLFADLWYVTWALECGYSDLGQAECDFWKRPYTYPSALLQLSIFQIDSGLTPFLGFLLIGAIGGGMWFLSRLSTNVGRVALTLMAISPSAMLLTERGNLEGYVFLALMASFYMGRDQILPALTSTLLIASAAFVKFLPSAALLVTPFFAPRQRITRLTFAVLLTSFAIIVLIPDLAHVRAPSQFLSAFGLPNLISIMSNGLEPSFVVGFRLAPLMGFIGLLGFATGVASWLSSRVTARGAFLPEKAMAAAGLVTVGVAFAGFSSFNYRLILLALAVPFLCRWISLADISVIASRFLICLLILATLAALSLPFTPLLTSATLFVFFAAISGWASAQVVSNISHFFHLEISIRKSAP